MPYLIRCLDIDGDCDFVAYGDTPDEVLLRISTHLRHVHQILGYPKRINDDFHKFITFVNAEKRSA